MSEDRALEILTDFANALEAAAVQMKRQISEVTRALQPTGTEEMFNGLKWKPLEASRIGAYEVADSVDNVAQKWTEVHDFLVQKHAVISARFHDQGFLHSYWTYGEARIYRQKLKVQSP